MSLYILVFVIGGKEYAPKTIDRKSKNSESPMLSYLNDYTIFPIKEECQGNLQNQPIILSLSLECLSLLDKTTFRLVLA